jgi:phosphatidylglycerol:prolipoprotein diacylglycerol transferase
MIPSPILNSITLGPLTLHFYGLVIGLAILTSYSLATKHASSHQIDTKLIDRVLLFSIPSAFLGARLIHVLGEWSYYSHHLHLIPAFWNGGLSILGAIPFAILAIFVLTKRSSVSFFKFTDFAAPYLALGQAIGRWGNYFNQELYGTPTDLPWGLYIDPQHRLPQFSNQATYHPLFLYESILNFLNFLILIWFQNQKPTTQVQRLNTITPTALYLINYGLIRLLMESLKIPDTTSPVFTYLSIFLLIFALALTYSHIAQHTRL